MKKSIYLIFAVVFSFIACQKTINPVSTEEISPENSTNTSKAVTVNYISPGYKKVTLGNFFDASSGKRCWVFVPHILNKITKATTVLFLHGWLMMAPEIYLAHIEHLVKQGYIVIYPQFDKAYIWGIATDFDQGEKLKNAIYGINRGIEYLGSKIDMNDIVVYGHSVGGLLTLTLLSGQDGLKVPFTPKALVMANPQVNPMATDDVPGFIKGIITTIDYNSRAALNKCPAIIITGQDDTMATPQMALEIYNSLTSVTSKVVYKALSVNGLKANHMASACDDGLIPAFLMDLVAGGACIVDDMDREVYWKALDTAIQNRTRVNFNIPVETMSEFGNTVF